MTEPVTPTTNDLVYQCIVDLHGAGKIPTREVMEQHAMKPIVRVRPAARPRTAKQSRWMGASSVWGMAA